jgi:hypothetical protein
MSDVIIRDKAEYHARTSEQMERHLDLPPWSLRQKIAHLPDSRQRGHGPGSPARSPHAATAPAPTGC